MVYSFAGAVASPLSFSLKMINNTIALNGPLASLDMGSIEIQNECPTCGCSLKNPDMDLFHGDGKLLEDFRKGTEAGCSFCAVVVAVTDDAREKFGYTPVPGLDYVTLARIEDEPHRFIFTLMKQTTKGSWKKVSVHIEGISLYLSSQFDAYQLGLNASEG